MGGQRSLYKYVALTPYNEHHNHLPHDILAGQLQKGLLITPVSFGGAGPYSLYKMVIPHSDILDIVPQVSSQAVDQCTAYQLTNRLYELHGAAYYIVRSLTDLICSPVSTLPN